MQTAISMVMSELLRLRFHFETTKPVVPIFFGHRQRSAPQPGHVLVSLAQAAPVARSSWSRSTATRLQARRTRRRPASTQVTALMTSRILAGGPLIAGESRRHVRLKPKSKGVAGPSFSGAAGPAHTRCRRPVGLRIPKSTPPAEPHRGRAGVRGTYMRTRRSGCSGQAAASCVCHLPFADAARAHLDAQALFARRGLGKVRHQHSRDRSRRWRNYLYRILYFLGLQPATNRS
jgi:hypothetical protein